jgi:hypothetical protein
MELHKSVLLLPIKIYANKITNAIGKIHSTIVINFSDIYGDRDGDFGDDKEFDDLDDI